MPVIALVQGFKLCVTKLDDFLIAGNVPPSCRYRLFPRDMAATADLFTTKGVDCEVRVFVPQREGYSLTTYLFVCCKWLYMHSARKVKPYMLPNPVPASFEAVRKSLQADSDVSWYIVHNEEDFFLGIPEELIAPFTCGLCDTVFSLWDDRTKRRRDEHGLSEGTNPLPDC
ncbi:uncharacterized protein BDZ99DRAFT_521019 [Mytilinidion resinicola]|uniref:Uncharacterized protein n=1 Tax=Mytilinidion resinicola TaxID=574789 RepID=A0A6A6YLL1_9PEZI|nr:uncharacterized protein BDZ99DRAFT_521019 [Mytilinidion resinicola]KAF2809690.1 hypothetical protein BDZ99DRAFT_521019 [Mytilinidion resinicola]